MCLKCDLDEEVYYQMTKKFTKPVLFKEVIFGGGYQPEEIPELSSMKPMPDVMCKLFMNDEVLLSPH